MTAGHEAALSGEHTPAFAVLVLSSAHGTMLERLHATRYVTPLREGGSLPALVEAEDDGLYVLKFRGAGQGPKALIAELLAGEIGRALGLPVPRLAFIELDGLLGRNEPDYEIRSLIVASEGLNLAMDYLPGSISFDPGTGRVAGALASAVVWFDAFIMNIDRTARNTNMLWWHKQLYLIDHGAALYPHHTWPSAMERATSPFSAIKDHVLLPWADDIAGRTIPGSRERVRTMLSSSVLEQIIGMIPESWLASEPTFASIDEHRNAYLRFLTARLEAAEIFEQEAIQAREGRHG